MKERKALGGRAGTRALPPVNGRVANRMARLQSTNLIEWDANQSWRSFLRTYAFTRALGLLTKSGQVNRSGENWPPESDVRPSPRPASQQVCPENPRKPATQRGARSGGERDASGNWRRECDPVQAVSLSRRCPTPFRSAVSTPNSHRGFGASLRQIPEDLLGLDPTAKLSRSVIIGCSDNSGAASSGHENVGRASRVRQRA